MENTLPALGKDIVRTILQAFLILTFTHGPGCVPRKVDIEEYDQVDWFSRAIVTLNAAQNPEFASAHVVALYREPDMDVSVSDFAKLCMSTHPGNEHGGRCPLCEVRHVYQVQSRGTLKERTRRWHQVDALGRRRIWLYRWHNPEKTTGYFPGLFPVTVFHHFAYFFIIEDGRVVAAGSIRRPSSQK